MYRTTAALPSDFCLFELCMYLYGDGMLRILDQVRSSGVSLDAIPLRLSNQVLSVVGENDVLLNEITQ